MTASELLANIVKAGILDEKTLDRLRRQVADPERAVKPRAIVKFLLERGLIDEQQGEDLLAGRELVPHLVEDPQFEVPGVPGKEHDTDDLTNILGTPAKSAPPAPAKSPPPQVAAAAERDPSGEAEEGDEAADMPARSRRPARETRMMEPAEAAEVAAAAGSNRPRKRKSREEPRADRDELAEAFGGSLSDSAGLAASAAKKGYAGKLDTTDQWNTRWLWTGFGILGGLLVAGAVLWLGVLRVDADKLFGEAETSYGNEAYGDAAAKFDKFVKNFPKHDKASLAKVRAVNAKIRFPYNSQDYNTAYKVAQVQLPTVIDEPAMNDELRPDLAVMLPTIAKWFSETAVKQKEVGLVKEKLDQAREVYRELIESPLYLTASQKNSPRNAELLTGVQNDILTAEGILKKEDDYGISMARIQELTAGGETDRAFFEFTRLVRTYPDLGARAELRGVMESVSRREVSLVRAATPELNIVAGPLPSPVSRQILTGTTVGTPIESLRGEVLPVLAEGAVYGVDAGSGALLWRHFVGLSTTIQPRWVNEDDRKNLLVCDQERHLVMSVDGVSGKVAWTAGIGQPFLAPCIGADGAFVATRSGMIVKLSLETGGQIGAAQLPRKMSAPCAIADQSPVLFAVGDDANLYILSTVDLTCTSVFYLGHFPGTVEIAPQYWSGHLLLAVNGSDFCDLVVLRPSEVPGEWQRLQQIRLASGRVASEPTRLGRMMLITSVNGDIRILDINPSEPDNPIRISSEEKFDVREGIRNWSHAAGSDMWIAGRGIMRYRIQRATGQLERVTIANGGDIYLGPLVKRDEVIFETRRRSGSRLVSVSAIHATTLEKIWRTDFGGPAAGSPFAAGQSLGLVNALGNLMQLDAGNPAAVAATEVSKASDIDEVFAFQRQTVLADGSVVCMGPPGFSSILRVSPDGKSAALSSLQPPAEKASAQPLPVGSDIVIPTSDGQLVRIDPSTGRFAGSPFLPPLSPGQQVSWNPPALVSESAFVIGNGQNGLLLIDGSDRGALVKLDEVAVDGQLQSPVLALGDTGFVVEQTANSIRLVGFGTAGGKLERKGEYLLESMVTQDPVVAGGWILLHTEDGKLTAVGSDFRAVWSVPLGHSRLAAAVASADGSLLLCMENGLVSTVSAGGELSGRFDLAQPIGQGPVSNGNQWLFPAADGTILVVEGGGS